MAARGQQENRKDRKKKKKSFIGSLEDSLFLHRIPEEYKKKKQKRKKQEVALVGGGKNEGRKMSYIGFYSRSKEVPKEVPEPPPQPTGFIGSLMAAAGSLSTKQLITLLAALPIAITILYPLIQTFLKRQRKRKHKRRRSHSDYWYDDQSERMLLSVHINERPRNKKKIQSQASSNSNGNSSGSRRRGGGGPPMNDDSRNSLMDTSRNSVMSNSSSYSISRRQRMVRQRQIDRFTNWGLSVRQLDPRLQIFQFFTEVAAVGASTKLERCKIHITGFCTHNCLGRNDPNAKKKGKKFLSLLPAPVTQRVSFGEKTPAMTVNQFLLADQCFDQASVFTVWRPTSDDAIRKMIRGEAVGKGLDIKGKSATKGKLSALVPVLQIHDDKHKPMLRHIPKDAIMRVYYQTQRGRNIAKIQLEKILKEMMKGYKEAARVVKTQNLLEQMLGERAQQLPGKFWKESLNRKYKWEIENPVITNLNHIGAGRFGLEMPQRLFVEAYIFRGDCHREPNTPNDTGRSSIPSFQDMNLETLRKYKPPKKPSSSKLKDQSVTPPRAVAFQFNKDPMQAMDPKDLVMAYEENDRVLPVVSDFDCFLVGTRRVSYRHPLPEKQIQMMSWCVDNIEKVLDDNSNASSWTGSWLEILKHERVKNGFKPEIPKYGYADPKSYAIMGHAIHHLQSNGSVRHGAECFNYYFPQDLDEQFLVVSYDIRNGGNRWRRFQRQDLLQFLSQKVDEGFMFPLNPKWILCDPGWKDLYDRQLSSKSSSVRQSINAWYPQSSGIRQRIEEISKRHPEGFVIKQPSMRRLGTGEGAGAAENMNGEMSMDQALMELEHAEKFQKAKRAIQTIIAVNRMRKALANVKSAEAKGIRGASLGRGSLPQKKQVISVKVPKDAMPMSLQQQQQQIPTVPLKRSNSFTISSLTEVVPIFRSLSFDFGVSPWKRATSGSANSLTALFSENKVEDEFPPPMEQTASLNSSEAHSLPSPTPTSTSTSSSQQPLEQRPKSSNSWDNSQHSSSSSQLAEQRPAQSRNSWDNNNGGSSSAATTATTNRPIPVGNVRRHRSERWNMNAAVNAAAKERNNNSNNNTTTTRYP